MNFKTIILISLLSLFVISRRAECRYILDDALTGSGQFDDDSSLDLVYSSSESNTLNDSDDRRSMRLVKRSGFWRKLNNGKKGRLPFDRKNDISFKI